MLLTIGMYFAVAVVVLSIALKIPGLDLLMRPIFQLGAKIIEFVLVSLGQWGYWIVLEIIGAHTSVIDHLMHNEEHYNVRLRVDRMNDEA